MKTLHVIDNAGEYSDHCIHFVVADPEEWGTDIGELLVDSVREGMWDKEPSARVRVLLTSDRFDIRDEESCCTVEDHLDPGHFIDFDNCGDKPTKLAARLGRKRAEKLAAIWNKRAEEHAKSERADFRSSIYGYPVGHEEFAAGIAKGWFGE